MEVALMVAPISRTMILLCALVAALPVGTHLGLLHLLWMLMSGRLLGRARRKVSPYCCHTSRRNACCGWLARPRAIAVGLRRPLVRMV